MIMLRYGNQQEQLKPDNFQIVNNEIITTEGMKYRIRNKTKKYGIVQYDVVKTMSGGNINENTCVGCYGGFLRDISSQYRGGMKQFLSGQPDIDYQMAQQFGGDEIRQLVEKHRFRSAQPKQYDQQQKFQLFFEGGDGEDMTQITQEMQNAVQHYYGASAEELIDLRNNQLVNQVQYTGGVKKGKKGKKRDEDCDCLLFNLDHKELKYSYDYTLSLPDNFMKDFAEKGEMTYKIDKQQYQDEKYDEDLKVYSKMKKRAMQNLDEANLSMSYDENQLDENSFSSYSE